VVGIIEGESTAEINAPIETVWALVQDVEKAPEWQNGLSDMEALERDDAKRAVVCESSTDAKVTQIKARVRFKYSEPTKLEWIVEKSAMKSTEGSWQLVDLGGGRTKATYWLRGDLGRLGLVVRGPLVDVLRGQLVGSRAEELKKAIEG
jgi:carbon monoxide dehydrogenase subunit G